MARKTASTLPSRQKAAQKGSWAAVGIDTSMSSLAVAAIGFDGMSGQVKGPATKVLRWTSENEYLDRLAMAAKSHELVLDVLHLLWVIDSSKVYVAVEEPFPLGMVKKMQSGWIKQQAQVSGAVLGSLMRYGYRNLFEVNNSTWKKSINDDVGLALKTKWDVKDWAIAYYDMPDLPDLVKAKTGGKIPRPESGFGANAKAEQPDDIYDAVGIMHYMRTEMGENV